MAECFPRAPELPSQSPLFWVSHKDRYLRQLLIRDIEQETGRDLIVYFTDCDRTAAAIDPGDDVYLSDLLSQRSRDGVDLLIETNGGATDATEKICALLRQAAPDLRVIVPRRAKSNGTVIALCGCEVGMSLTSELGPIDPSINGIPTDFVMKAPAGTFNPIELQVFKTAALQTRKLAMNLLKSGMMKDLPEDEIQKTVDKLATRDHYHSHGSVIDMAEAKALKLKVREFADTDPLWKKFWLLRTMYAFDCGQTGHAKVFEGPKLSAAVTLSPQNQAKP